MKMKKWDLLICLGLAAILLIFVFELPNTNAAARVYPMIMLIASYFLMAVICVQWIRNKKAGKIDMAEGMDKKRMVYIAVYCAAILVYILLIERLGYVVSTILFGVYSLIYLKNKNKILIVIIPVAAAVILYFLFSRFLFVTLPSGILI